jgi:hypothetical protein
MKKIHLTNDQLYVIKHLLLYVHNHEVDKDKKTSRLIRLRRITSDRFVYQTEVNLVNKYFKEYCVQAGLEDRNT